MEFLYNLRDCLKEDIIDKINCIPIPMNNIEDKLAWKFTPSGEFSVKIPT